MSVVDDARRALGPVGAFLPVVPGGGDTIQAQRAAARRLEALGYRAAWTNELIGKDALAQLGVLLAATEGMVFGTSIANIWARPPQTAHGAAAVLAEAYPGRFVLGLGVGYPPQADSVGRDYGRPLATMRDYLNRMAAEPAATAYARIVGANGPKMQALAGELADGALPATGGPHATEQARSLLGPDKLLVVYLDASAGQGDPAAVAATVRGHLDAGADHIIAGTPLGAAFGETVERLEELAPTLLARS